jgi:hypothetical protein
LSQGIPCQRSVGRRKTRQGLDQSKRIRGDDLNEKEISGRLNKELDLDVEKTEETIAEARLSINNGRTENAGAWRASEDGLHTNGDKVNVGENKGTAGKKLQNVVAC